MRIQINKLGQLRRAKYRFKGLGLPSAPREYLAFISNVLLPLVCTSLCKFADLFRLLAPIFKEQDPDPYSEAGSGSTGLIDCGSMQIRIRYTALK
jgi:hypothetical protein